MQDLADQVEKSNAMGDAALAKAKASELLDNLVDCTSPDNYMNYYVRSHTSDSAGNQVGVAGSVNVNFVDNSSKVIIGKNTELTAGQNMSVNSQSVLEGISFTGDASKFFLPSSSGSTGIGASVAVQSFTADSLTAIGEGVKMTSKDSLNITADNKLEATGVVYTAGTADSTGVSGMVNIMSGESNSVVAVDDEAVLKTVLTHNTQTGEISGGELKILANNNTNVIGIAGGLSKASTASVGAGVAVIDYDVNTVAGVLDIGTGSTSTVADDGLSEEEKSANKKAKQAVKLVYELSGHKIKDLEKPTDEELKDLEALTNMFGDSAVNPNEQGSITTYKFDMNANTTGEINAVGVAGAVATANDSDKEEEKEEKDGFFSKIGNFFKDKANNIKSGIENTLTDVDKFIAGGVGDKIGYTPTDAVNSGSTEQGGGNNSLVDENAASTNDTVHVSGAGSGAINLLEGDTVSILKGANLNLIDDDSATISELNVAATDSLFAGAWAGGAAVNWVTSTKEQNQSTTVGVAGAVGANIIDRNVASLIMNSDITDFDIINNYAGKDGAEVAAGLGLALSKASGEQAQTAAAGAAAVSYNSVSSDIQALMLNNTAEGSGSYGKIANRVYNADIQVTGGLNAAVAVGSKQNVGVGGSVVISKLDNNMTSAIIGGDYDRIDGVDVSTAVATKQIGAGVGIAVTAGGDGSKNSAFEGVVVYNSVNNQANAFLKNTSINENLSGLYMPEGVVSVRAYDTAETSQSNQNYAAYIKNRGLDADGSSYADAARSTEKKDGSAAVTTSSDDDNITVDYDQNMENSLEAKGESGGNFIVSGALSVAAAGNGSAGVGAAVNIDDITNNFTAGIYNSKVAMEKVEATADTDTFIVGAAAGAAGSGKFGGAGSVSWENLANTTQVKIEKTTIKSLNTDFLASNDTVAVNVAGQVAAGKAAVGLALAYTGMNNATNVSVNDLHQTSQYAPNVLTANANSAAKLYTVGAGVSASTGGAAINGTIAINKGANNTEAIIKDSEIQNNDGLTVTANDATKLLAVAGGVSAGTGSAVGGAVAYNDIGGALANANASKQNIAAKLLNTDISIYGYPSAIKIAATDNAAILTEAAGIGIDASGGVAVQGSAATTLINKNVTAEMSGIGSLDGNISHINDVTVEAENDSKILTNATVVGGAGTVAIGAGVGVNRINQVTEAIIDDVELDTDKTLVTAIGRPNIIATGIGGAGAGSVAVAGSFGVNMIDNDVKAVLKNSTISSNNIGVVAQSDESIANYAGGLAGAGNVAVGLASAVNTITGDTIASVENSYLEASTSDEEEMKISTHSLINDSAIVDGVLQNLNVTNKLADKRQEEKLTGLVIDSSATHDIKSVVASAGGSGSVAAMGTVNVNTVSGSTKAELKDSTVNSRFGPSSMPFGDIFVRAADYTNAAGLVGSDVASGSAAIGAASDTNLLKRLTEASVTDNNALISNNLTVDAVSKQGISSFAVGVAAAAEGAGAAGTVSVANLQGATKALVDNSNIYANNVAVTADHLGRSSVGNGAVGMVIGGGVGAGVSVSITDDDNEVSAELKDSKIISDNYDSSLKIKAKNETELNSLLAAVGIGGGGIGAAGVVGVNNIDNNVNTLVSNSSFSSDDDNNSTIDIEALNKITADANGGSVGGGSAVGIGASVMVNTINSTVDSKVDNNSQLKATGDINISAQDIKDISQTVVNAAVGGMAALNANVMVTNVGSQIDNDEALAAIELANSSQLDRSDSLMGLTSEEKQAQKQATGGEATAGSSKGGTGVNVNDSELTAKGSINIGSETQEAVTMRGGGASGSASVSANAAVGILNVNHRTEVNIDSSKLSADKNIALNSQIGDYDGKGSSLSLYQGAVSLVSVGAAYGDVNVTGLAGININAADMNAKQAIDVSALDNSTAEIGAYGLTAGAIGAGAIIAGSENISNVQIDIAKSDIASGEELNINAQKQNKVSAEAVGGAVGIGAGVGVSATASDSGKAAVVVAGGGNSSTLQGQTVQVTADNSPQATVQALNVAAGLAAVQATQAKADISSAAVLNIADGNTIQANKAWLSANIGRGDQLTADVTTLGVGLGAGAVAVNQSTAKTASEVTVDVGKLNYQGYNSQATNRDDDITVNIYGTNNISQKADTSTMTLGGIAIGNSHSVTDSKNTINVSASGGNVKDLVVKADGSAANTSLADGNGGGILSLSPNAGFAESILQNNVTTNVNGSWNVDGTAGIFAEQSDKSNVHVDTTHVGLIDVTGAKTLTDISGTAKTNLSGNLMANSLSAAALNHVITGDEYKIAVEGKSYGAAAKNSLSSEENINRSAEVNILDNADITTNNGQSYEAATDISANNSIHSEAAGAVSAAVTNAISKTTVDNSVNLGKGAKLSSLLYKENSDSKVNAITMAAYDNLTLKNAADANIPIGLAGTISSQSDNILERSNTISIDGVINSAGDINLYAGADKDGKDATLNMDLLAATYNHTALPLHTKPSINNSVTENNKVLVNTTGAGNAVRHINVSADNGEDKIKSNTTYYSWVSGGEDNKVDYVTSANGTVANGVSENSMVQVDGALNAGIHNKVDITISGIVTPEDSVLEDGTHGEYTIVVPDFLEADITTGTFDYGNSLFKRYQELQALIQAYSGKLNDKELAAYAGYQQELTQLLNEMKEKGLYDDKSISETKDKNGIYYAAGVVLQSYKVNYIELPDITASGGSININTDNLSGRGELNANGAPSVNITNTSSAYLKVNNITIGETGGEIIYNGNNIGKDGNDAINKINKGSQAVFQAVKNDVASNATAVINITNNYTGGDIKVKADRDYLESQYNGEAALLAQVDWEAQKELKPISTIEINGIIQNSKGEVNITNSSGDIIIQGKDATSQAGVSGETITLSANNGSISQGYTDGIVNIGGTPEDIYADAVKELEDSCGLTKLDKDNNPLGNMEIVIDKDSLASSNSSKGGWIAGNAVYISAADINVNDIIQSGYAKYTATITDDSLNAAASAAATKDMSKLAQVNGVTMYKVNDGGKAVYDKDTGVYYYEVQVYYNPVTKGLVVEDVSTAGGKVYLTGNISSTGNGQIIAVDGGADISIINKTKADIDLGKVENNDREGIISITDLNKNRVSVYTNTDKGTNVTVTDIQGNLVEEDTQTANSKKDSYDVTEGLRYNWTHGTDTSTKLEYETAIKAGLWGAIDVSKVDVTNLKDVTVKESGNGAGGNPVDKISGTYIGTVAGISDSKDESVKNMYYTLIADNVEKNSEVSPVTQWTTTSGFLNWFHTQHLKWTVTTGTSQTYLSSLKADYDIGIKFIGQENGSINLTGNGNINLLGDISNNTSQATLNIAAQGAINQSLGNSIQSNNVSLQAQNGINGINLISMAGNAGQNDIINLAATTTNGNIDINSLSAVNVGKLQSENGNVALTTFGNITQNGSALTVKGNRIDLISTNGSIGDASQSLVIQAGQNVSGSDTLSASVNAKANGNISLSQKQGDMRIGTIVSENGDVTLVAADGSFIDALPVGDIVDNVDAEAMVQRWKDMGLIDDGGNGSYSQKWAEDKMDYEADINNAYAEYEVLRSYYENHSTDTSDPTFAAYEKLSEMFNGYDSAQAYLDNEKSTDGSRYKELCDGPSFEWTEKQLLYAIDNATVNKDVGSTDTEVKKANVSGRSITLTGQGVGIDKESTTISTDGLFENLDDPTQLAKLQTILNSEGSDVTWDTANKQVIIGGKSPIGIDASGLVNVNLTQNGGNIYLAARSEDGSDANTDALRIGQINSAGGDIRLLGKNGVINALDSDNKANLIGKNLIVEGGKADIGAAEKYLTVDLLGSLTARTESSAYIKSVGSNDMQLGSMYAGDSLNLQSGGNISMGDDVDELAYLNAKKLSIKADGSIGTDDEGVRVLANEAVVDAEADGDIVNINGVGEQGGLILHNIAGNGKVIVSSDDKLLVGESTIGEDGQAALGTVGTITAGNSVSLSAANDLLLNGSVTKNDGGKLTELNLTSSDGDILQLLDGTAADDSRLVKADVIKAAADNSLQLVSLGNEFNNLQIQGYNNDSLNDQEGSFMHGDLIVTANLPTQASTASGLNVQFLSGDTANPLLVDGKVTITNVATGGNISLNGAVIALNGAASEDDSDSGEIKLISEGSIISTGSIQSDKAIELTAGNNITVDTVQAGTDIVVTGAALEADKLAANGNASVTASGAVDVNKLAADNKLTLTAGGDITTGTVDADELTISGSQGMTATTVTVGGNANVTAQTDVAITNLNSQGNVIVQTNEGCVTGTDWQAAGSLNVENGKGDIQVDKLTAADDVTVNAQDGKVAAESITSTGGNASVTASGAVDVNKLAADNKLTLTAGGDITTGTVDADELTISGSQGMTATTVTVGGNANVTAQTDVAITNLNSQGNVIVQTNEGGVTGTDWQSTAGSLNVETGKGDIIVHKLNAADNLVVSTQDGSVTADSITSTGGDASVTASGAVDVNKLAADNKLTLTAGGEITTDTVDADELTVSGGQGMTATTVTVDGNANVTAQNDVTITNLNSQGNVIVQTSEGGVTGTDWQSTAGSLNVETGKGDIIVNKLNAADNLVVSTQDGSVTAESITSTGGDASVTASGAVDVNKLAADNKLTLTAGGEITTDTVNAGELTVSGSQGMTATTVTVGGNASVTAQTDVVIDNLLSQGNVIVQTSEGGVTGTDWQSTAGSLSVGTVNGDISLNTMQAVGDIAAHTTNGGITSTNVVSTAGGVSLTTTNGNITMNDVTAAEMVTLDVAQHGNITGNDVQSLNNNLSVYTANGDVNWQDVYANKDAMVGTSNGQLNLSTVNGENLIIAVKNPASNMHIGDMTAGIGVIVTGSKIDVNSIVQREGYDNMLSFTPNADGGMMDYLTISSIDAPNGLLIPQLWVNNADIHVNSNKFYIEKLSVKDVAYFSTNNASAVVYGGTPQLEDNKDFQFWHKYDGANNWTSLLFLSTPHSVQSDALLMKNDNYYYAYNQRQSSINYLLNQENQQIGSDTWKKYQHSVDMFAFVDKYSRYDLLDMDRLFDYEAVPEPEYDEQELDYLI